MGNKERERERGREGERETTDLPRYDTSLLRAAGPQSPSFHLPYDEVPQLPGAFVLPQPLHAGNGGKHTRTHARTHEAPQAEDNGESACVTREKHDFHPANPFRTRGKLHHWKGGALRIKYIPSWR